MDLLLCIIDSIGFVLNLLILAEDGADAAQDSNEYVAALSDGAVAADGESNVTFVDVMTFVNLAMMVLFILHGVTNIGLCVRDAICPPSADEVALWLMACGVWCVACSPWPYDPWPMAL